MATALDFRALLAAERQRARRPKKESSNLKETVIAKENLVEAADTHNEAGGAGLPPPVPASHGSTRPIKLRPKLAIDLRRFRVSGALADEIFYIPDFFSLAEGIDLVTRIDDVPISAWTDLRRRRLQNHGGTPHPDGMHPLPVPHFVKQLFDALVSAGVFPAHAPPNHALINSYKLGQGISPHKDGPLYAPLVAIVSLNGPAMLQFWGRLADTKTGAPVSSVLCLPNSLLVFRGAAYKTHWHGISEASADVLATHTGNAPALGDGYSVGKAILRGARRVSVTIRQVLHVHPADNQILTGAAREEQRRKDTWWLASRGEHGLFGDRV